MTTTKPKIFQFRDTRQSSVKISSISNLSTNSIPDYYSMATAKIQMIIDGVEKEILYGLAMGHPERDKVYNTFLEDYQNLRKAL